MRRKNPEMKEIPRKIKTVLSELPQRKKRIWSYGGNTLRTSSLEGYRGCDAVLRHFLFNYALHLFRHWHALKFVMDFAKKDSVVADVGCSYAELGRMMANHVKFAGKNVQYIGLEMVEGRLSSAEKHMRSGFEYCLIQCDLSTGRLPFHKESLDLVVFMEVIEHLEKESGEGILKAIYESLKWGGRLLFSAPFASAKKSELPHAYHIYMRTQVEYEQLLRAIGFHIEREMGLGMKGPSSKAVKRIPAMQSLLWALPPQIARSLGAFMVDPAESRAASFLCLKTQDHLSKMEMTEKSPRKSQRDQQLELFGEPKKLQIDEGLIRSTEGPPSIARSRFRSGRRNKKGKKKEEL